jgi:hypothetical protein
MPWSVTISHPLTLSFLPSVANWLIFWTHKNVLKTGKNIYLRNLIWKDRKGPERELD